MDHVKKLRGRRAAGKFNQVNLDNGPVVFDRDLPEGETGIMETIRLRDQHVYVTLEKYQEGWLVAELQPDFGKMGEVHFWRKEFIEEIKRRGYVIPDRKKKK